MKTARGLFSHFYSKSTLVTIDIILGEIAKLRCKKYDVQELNGYCLGSGASQGIIAAI